MLLEIMGLIYFICAVVYIIYAIIWNVSILLKIIKNQIINKRNVNKKNYHEKTLDDFFYKDCIENDILEENEKDIQLLKNYLETQNIKKKK